MLQWQHTMKQARLISLSELCSLGTITVTHIWRILSAYAKRKCRFLSTQVVNHKARSSQQGWGANCHSPELRRSDRTAPPKDSGKRPAADSTHAIYTSYKPSARPVRQVMDRDFSLPFMAQARKQGNKEGKNEDPYLAVRTEQTRLIRCLLYGSVDNYDRELEVRTATTPQFCVLITHAHVYFTCYCPECGCPWPEQNVWENL